MNFNILQKPETSGDQREQYRWFYRICEILNDIGSIIALGTGFVVKTSAETYTVREIEGSTAEVDVANGSGASGNPTISLPTIIISPRSFGDGANQTTFEADGFMVAEGGAVAWQDIDFPIVIRTTGVGIPALTTLNGRLTMPQWAVNDFNVCESQEFVHLWVEGSTVYWHLHLTTNGLDVTDRYVRFELEYGYCTVNGQWVFPAVINTGDLLIPANTPSKTMLILSLGNFTPSGVHVGGHTVAYLKRIASVGAAPTSNPWIPMLQQHIQCDTLGSRQISAK